MVQMTKVASAQLTAQPARTSLQPTRQAAATESEAVGPWVTSPMFSLPVVTVMTKDTIYPVPMMSLAREAHQFTSLKQAHDSQLIHFSGESGWHQGDLPLRGECQGGDQTPG
ncbi:unnamed protein product [Gulo gulo]|uniref:Uncharacterized protein n=1 Tax=Gulo gulo TaxID=48420 RepID=A0A9X9LW67_GULGU|nr:unnamed protein product [Gulo gulo]